MAACITVNWDCNPEIRDSVDPGDVANRDRAELFAQGAIQVLTGRQLGNCPITVRPCLEGCEGDVATYMGGPFLMPFIKDGRWYNSCGCKPNTCSCEDLDIILLDGPVAEILSVTVDGVVLPTTDYRVDNGNELVRTGGEPWPTCQDMAAPTTAEKTMAVKYIQGASLDALGEFIAGLLANEFLNACNGGECSLPFGVTSLARQGVDIEFGPTIFPNGRTGIDAVDLWIETWNPYKVKSPSRIYSVDKVRPRQTTRSA
jgi:hypothetical protein